MWTYICHGLVALVGVAIVLSSPLRADIQNWQTGETIVGTEGITLGPGIDLSRRHGDSRNLRSADFSGGLELSRSLFYDSWLDNARFTQANLAGASFIFATLTNADLSQANLSAAVFNSATMTNADLSDAVVKGAHFAKTTARGFTKDQLYSTASYRERTLQGIGLHDNDLSGWDFAGQDLTGARLAHVRLTNANVTGAIVRGTQFCEVTSRGFTKEQLYSTASYQERNLHGIGLYDNDLSGWDFAGQDLTNANLCCSTLANANLTGANVKGADFYQTVSLASAVFSPQTLYNQWTRFPSGFDPQAAGLTFVTSPPGDFDANDVLDAADIDLLARRINGEEVLFWQFAMFDLDTSSAIDAEDRRVWVHELKKTWFGDANLDGVFNNGDLVTLLQAGEYEDGLYGNSSWGTGDWDGDGDFTRQDLALALQDGGYGQGPRAALAAVPEPSSWCLLAVRVLAMAQCTRAIGRRRSRMRED
jgi:uncharacterized protein YjbI with pentapeptide repeats